MGGNLRGNLSNASLCRCWVQSISSMDFSFQMLFCRHYFMGSGHTLSSPMEYLQIHFTPAPVHLGTDCVCCWYLESGTSSTVLEENEIQNPQWQKYKIIISINLKLWKTPSNQKNPNMHTKPKQKTAIKIPQKSLKTQKTNPKLSQRHI